MVLHIRAMRCLTVLLLMPGLVLLSLKVTAGPLASYDARLTAYPYPYPVENFAFKSQGQSLEMAYMYLPAEPGKATVVLLHGKNFGSDYWQKTAGFLHAQGYGVLMPDQIGFGKSSKPDRYQFSFEGLASNTRALLQSLAIEKAIIMGHSMGGMLAVRYSLMYGNQVSKLTLLNPIGLEDYLEYVEYKDPEFFYRQELKKHRQVSEPIRRKIIMQGSGRRIMRRYSSLRMAGWRVAIGLGLPGIMP